MKKHTRWQKVTALFLCLLLVVSVLPVSAFATGTQTVALTIKTSLIAENKPMLLRLTDANGNPVTLQDITPDYDSGTETSGIKCGIYTVNVSAGTCQYTAYDPITRESIGAGSFAVTAEAQAQEVFLSAYNFYGSNAQPNLKNADNIAFTLKITGPDGKTDFPVGDSGYTAVLPARTGGTDGAYTYAFIPEDDTYWGSSGRLWVYELSGRDSFRGLNLSDTQMPGFLIAPKKTIRIQVESGAEVRLSRIVRFYRPFEYIEGVKIDSDETTDTYEFVVPDTSLYYEVRKENKITRVDSFQVSDYADGQATLTVPALKDNPNQVLRDASQGYFDASILLNGPTSKMLSLQPGESFDIVAFRAWQAVASTTANNYVDPDFHYTLVSGDSVTLRDDGRITAIAPGVSVIQVTYDALEWRSSGMADENGLMVYSAIWPERTGVYVVNVADPNTSNVQTNIGLTEYDTIYYAKTINGEAKDTFAQYSFTPTADGPITVRVQKPLTADWESGWETYTPDDSGAYTVKLYDGPNIVEVKSGNSARYHVVYANGLNITIENLYSPNRQTLCVGDTIKISFDGLVSPIPKLGAVYNPGYGGTEYIEYSLNGDAVEGSHAQWFVSKTSVTMKLLEEGDFTLTDGKIHEQSTGSVSTTHQSITKESLVSSYSGELSGETVNGYFCVLPDISYTVESAEAYQEELALNYIKISTSIKPSPALAGAQGNPMLGRTARTTNFFCTAVSGSAANTPTVVKSGLLPQNIVVWNVAQFLTAKAAPVYVRVKPDTQDVSMVLRYWSTAEGHTEPVSMPLNYNETTSTAAFACLNDIACFELIVTPDEGVSAYPKSYCLVANSSSGSHYGKLAYLYGLELTALDGQDSMKPTDGLLHADEHDGIDFGYGFLGTETDYTVNVPYATSQITLTPTALEEGTTVTVCVNGETVANQTASQTIALAEGVNTIPVTVTVSDGETIYDTITYTVKVNRAEEPKTVTFQIPDGATVTVLQGDKTVKANEDGTYTLEDGSYTYAVSKDGYLSVVETLEIAGSEKKITVTVTDLQPVPKQAGTATVRISGQSSVLRDITTVTIPDTVEDLAGRKYVQYNHGGYTVLHALLDALRSGKLSFQCSKGALIPTDEILTDGLGENAGWVCQVNGEIVIDPANTLVQDGDKIEYYYNSDYPDMTHAWFTESTVTLAQGNGAVLTLVGTPVDGGTAAPVSNATVYVDGTAVGTTDENGNVAIPATALGILGERRVTARRLDANGRNTLTGNLATITVQKTAIDKDGKTTTVTFRLVGDKLHTDGEHGYITWIATTAYTFDSDNVTVGDVFQKALDENQLEYEGLSNGYISKITAPAGLGGYTLGEKDNGANSGWMYTVNGIHADVGLNQCIVQNGDQIVWHYVDDYIAETADAFEGTTGTPGSWDLWLRAEDENPGYTGANADTTIRFAAVNGFVADQDTHTVTLPFAANTALPTDPDAVIVKATSTKAVVSTPVTGDHGASWNITVTAENGETATCTIYVVMERDPAVKAVETLIDAIGDVSLDSGAAIQAARDAYDALTPEQQVLIGNLQTLLAAEEQYAHLVDCANGRHTYGDWTLITAAACTTQGRMERYCIYCDNIDAMVTAPLGHKLNDGNVTKEATCTEAGTMTYICLVCGETVTESIAKLPHSYEETVTLPTCEGIGYTTHTCIVCGDSYMDTMVEAPGHDYRESVIAPTCDKMGYTLHTCTRCDSSYIDAYTDALEHEFEQTVTKEPTCTEEGELTFTCADCGKTYTQILPKTDHACETTVVDPTCVGYGYTEYKCKNCDYSYITNLVQPNGHDYKLVNAREATCTGEGYTGDLVCSVCGDVKQAGEGIPATSHTWGEWEITEEANCFTDGEETHTCSVCGEVEIREISANSDNCPSRAFSDLNTEAWYHEGVDFVLRTGLMVGTAVDKFSPNGTVTRGQLVAILYRLAEKPDVENLTNAFTDVDSGAYYASAVLWAEYNDIVFGVGNHRFNPEGEVTRQDMVVILYRYAAFAGYNLTADGGLDDYPDAEDVASYAENAMVWAVNSGLISGTTAGADTILAPLATSTRAQLAAVMQRFVEKMVKE